MNIEFKDQNILVTGGTKGIGKKLIEDFRSKGGNVWYTGRDPEIIEDNYFCVDFTDTIQMSNFLKKIALIEFDVIIVNAFSKFF